jgi:hypothetical protein
LRVLGFKIINFKLMSPVTIHLRSTGNSEFFFW